MTPARTATQSGSAVVIKDLEFAYSGGPFRINIPDFQVRSGESLALVGPSGSGKTTLLHLIAGILAPNAGTITVGDFSTSAADDAARRHYRLRHIGMIFQEFELIEALSVQDNIRLPYLLEKGLVGEAAAEERLHQLADGVGIGKYLERKPARLSQGERQRVAICRALMTSPALILADEPTGNLDPRTAGTILDLIAAEVGQRATTFIMVTHDHGVLNRFDRQVDFAEFRSE